jgi:hypothetical protein
MRQEKLRVTVTVRIWPVLRICGVLREVPVKGEKSRAALPDDGFVVAFSVSHVCGLIFRRLGVVAFRLQKPITVCTALMLTF